MKNRHSAALGLYITTALHGHKIWAYYRLGPEHLLLAHQLFVPTLTGLTVAVDRGFFLATTLNGQFFSDETLAETDELA